MAAKNEQGTMDDMVLWHSFTSGDEQAFICLYDKYVNVLYFFGLQYTADKDLIKDCIQDTFVKAYQGKHKLKHIKNIKSYLCVTLKNNIININKREQLYLQYLHSIDPSNEYYETIETQIIKKEIDSNVQKKVEKIVSQLSSRQKEVIYYRFFKGKSINEISDIMNVNYQSVQNIIQRSMKKAKEFFLKK